jgi:hypothetical protein
MTSAYVSLDLSAEHLAVRGRLTDYGELIVGYFKYRASVLTDEVQHLLMDATEAQKLYAKVTRRYTPWRSPQPMNKQKNAMRAPAFLTCLVNTIIEEEIGSDIPCDWNPLELTAITRDGRPLRTLARRVDGAFPSATNPVALWEIKEYYYTTTFGSRVADGVYESLLDGMELEELREHEDIDVLHYLIIDARMTWWDMGKSYLCRMIDMIHQGYVDEVLFGREVVTRLPILVKEWIARLPEAEERQAGFDGRLL